VVVLKIQTIESETVAKALLELHKKTKGFSIYESDEINKSELIKNTKPVSPQRTVFYTLIYFNCPKKNISIPHITICYNAFF
jgi:hypothetical protein